MRVVGGRYEGDTGLIVRVEENMIVLFRLVSLLSSLYLTNDWQ